MNQTALQEILHTLENDWLSPQPYIDLVRSKLEKERLQIINAYDDGSLSVSGWHFLPEMPEINKEVLVAVKYDNEPVQAFWTGKEWKGSFLVRDNMADGFVRDESYKHIQEWIYAWMELPQVPPIPEPL